MIDDLSNDMHRAGSDSLIQVGARLVVRRVHPLWLREKLFYHLTLRFSVAKPTNFAAATLHFAPLIRMQLSPTDVAHRMIASTGFYELPVSSRIASLARKGGLLVDVGANYGYYSYIWAAAHSGNRVAAFEVVPANLAALRDNISLNDLERQIVVTGEAVGNRTGKALFRFGPEDQTGQGGLVATAGGSTIAVDMTTLDERFMDSGEIIDVLKIDVEGADTWVLEGAERLLAARRIRHIFFEQFPARMAALGIGSDRARDLLVSHRYGVSEIGPSEYYATILG